MDEHTSGSGGPLESVRRIGRSMLGLVQTRVELFALEFQEEKLRALNLLVWCAIAIALGVAGVLLAVGTLALFLWQTAGYVGLVSLSAGVLAAATALLWIIHRRILHGPAPFAGTAAEFRKDAESFRSSDVP